MVALVFSSACEIMPRNSLKDCQLQCKDSNNPKACYDFCDCIHKNCQPLDTCLAEYDKALEEMNVK
jgi:hypothetical protein